jgi:hypothetical protein
MCKTKAKMRRVPSYEEKMQAVELLINRLNQAFVLYFWVKTVRPMLATHPKFQDHHFGIRTVEHACVQSFLINVRALDDFFAKQDEKNHQHRDDDTHAYDFSSCKSLKRFLNQEERNSINRWVSHPTYYPVWEGKTGIPPDEEQFWNPDYLVQKATSAMCGFMDCLASEFYRNHPDKAESIRKTKGVFECYLKAMENTAKSTDSCASSFS